MARSVVGLARAVGADEAHQLALLDDEVDALHGADAAVVDLDLLQCEQGHQGLTDAKDVGNADERR